MKNVKKPKELMNLANTAIYAITGAGGSLEEWKKGYETLLAEENIGKPVNWYYFKGKLMNETYNLTGSNRYPDDITFLCFSLNGLNIGKLAIFKFRMRDRWLEDIISNNLHREEIAEELKI